MFEAGAEVSCLLGRIPSAVGYQSTLELEIGTVQDRICSTKKGSITSVQTVYVPGSFFLYVEFRLVFRNALLGWKIFIFSKICFCRVVQNTFEYL